MVSQGIDFLTQCHERLCIVAPAQVDYIGLGAPSATSEALVHEACQAASK